MKDKPNPWLLSLALLLALVAAYRYGKLKADRWYAKHAVITNTIAWIGVEPDNKCIVYAVSDKTPGDVTPILIPNCKETK